jgi:lipopolysaccharide biosynthesis regulator YciM
MMKSTRWIAAVIFSPTLLFAQFSDLNSQSTQLGAQAGKEVAVLNGNLVADGSSLPEPANVLLQCGNQLRGQQYSDTKGNFSLTIYVTDQTPASMIVTQKPVLSSGEWADCELYADIAGYRSDRVRLAERPNRGSVDVGTVELHSVTNDPGLTSDPRFTVSVTSLAAPEKARKAFNKGEQEERKGKLEAACEHFKNALAVYPRYALAWLELGRVQARQNSFIEAHESFRQAVTQDAKLTDGYVELARVAAQQQNWKELAEVSDNLVQRSPDSSAEYWFLNSAAYYKLDNLKQAEDSITRGLRLDPRHQLARMEYLYGLILGSKKDYKSAMDHISNYLRLAPDSKDATAARQTLAAYQQHAQLADAEQH